MRPDDVTRALVAAFNNNHYEARCTGQGDSVGVHLCSRRQGSSVLLAVRVERLEEETAVSVGEPDGVWNDAAATVGKGLLAGAVSFLGSTLKKEKMHPGMIPLLAAGMFIKQLPETMRNARLDEQVWFIVEQVVRSRRDLSELSRQLLTCKYCAVINRVGATACQSCGAPLARTVKCPHCELVNAADQATCRGCGSRCGEATPAPAVRFCAQCGTRGEPDDRFCTDCGERLE